MRTRRSRARRLFGASCVALVALAAPGTGIATAQAPPETAETAPSEGVVRSGGDVLGTVSTQVISVVPSAGRLPLPVKLAASGAQIDAKVRRSQAAVADFGLLGTLGLVAVQGAPTLTRLGIPVSQFTSSLRIPPAAVADTRDSTHVEGRPVLPPVAVGPLTAGGGHQVADARSDGAGVGRAELGDARLDLGLVQVVLAGGASESYADPTRVKATTSLGEMRFESQGTVVGRLEGLVWRFEQLLGKAPTSSFSIGSGTFGALAQAVPLPGGSATVAETLTRTLAPFGVHITLPEARPTGLSPLRLAIVDPPLGEQFGRPAYETLLAKAVNDAQGAIVAGVPETGLALTVANVVLGILTGRGGTAIELGEITGGIGTRPLEEFTYGGLPEPPLPALPDLDAAPAMDVPPPASGPFAPAPASAPSDAPPSGAAAPPPAATAELAPVVARERFPAIVILGLGAGLALGLAALDRRRIASMGGRS